MNDRVTAYREAIHLALHDGDDFPDPAPAFGQKFYYIFRLYSDPATRFGFSHISALLEQHDVLIKCASITRPLPGSKLGRAHRSQHRDSLGDPLSFETTIQYDSGPETRKQS
ncbi:hypothetical protein LTR70_008831 [Exophiala xenobiotica]|uniref:Uncharacterized protein n=1 Tax=Lithohypha guttulata TaxID=1690604 RepID=A0ABR0K1B6_9EURO|nr:hypothetical protein LTR24_008509 [Lithohypha guttulata]KAK5311357.1 hypothetical protein LTR70_008831 [Exophiala xenobiotica]